MSLIRQLSTRRRGQIGHTGAADGGRKWKVLGALAVATVIVGGGLGVAAAGTSSSSSRAASPGRVSCPTVADKLPPVPAAARAEVSRNLALLNKQIEAANARIVSTVGQGGPNFVRNAILGPLASKRTATIDRIRIAYDRRGVVVTGLGGLATCQLVRGNSAGAQVEPTEVPLAPAGGDKGKGKGNAGAADTVNCPTVADKLPPVPAAARAEVSRNLALLDKQIEAANARIVSTVGQGGPNFVRNAILGPLASKRTATIDRIRIAYDRRGVVVTGLGGLATCSLN